MNFHFLQGILTGINMMCYYLGVLYTPLGDALTIIYTSPIFTMVFSLIFLRIRVGMWKITLGIVLMVRMKNFVKFSNFKN